MRKIVIAVMSTISGLVMLFGYHTSTNSEAATASSTTAEEQSSGNSSDSSSSSSNSSNSSNSSDSSSGTYTGDAVSTQWGTVQVRITVEGGKITASEAVQYPNNNHRDQQINAYAVPLLNQQAVQEQSADIDGVSGATVTSEGYAESLQSAIDKADL